MYQFLKRIIDILIALIALLLLSPILIPTIIILFFSGEREVFYFQKRIGQRGKAFFIWMNWDWEHNGVDFGRIGTAIK